MTERTIEETVEVTEESTVRICEDCGLEVDNGVTLTAKDEDIPDLHVHRDCIPNMMLEGDEYVRTVGEVSRHSENYSIIFALDKEDVILAGIGILFAVFGIPMLLVGLVTRAPPLLLIAVGLVIVSFFALRRSYKYGRQQAQQPIDEVFR